MRDLPELSMIEEGPPVRDSDVLLFEQTIGVTLPSDYVRLLKHWNGGAPELSAVQLDNGEEWSVSFFYILGMNPNDERDLMWAFRIHSGFLPTGVVPFAFDGGGNLTCLDLRPNAQFEVVAWDHERAAWLCPIARTFREFIDRLYRPDYS